MAKQDNETNGMRSRKNSLLPSASSPAISNLVAKNSGQEKKKNVEAPGNFLKVNDQHLTSRLKNSLSSSTLSSWLLAPFEKSLQYKGDIDRFADVAPDSLNDGEQISSFDFSTITTSKQKSGDSETKLAKTRSYITPAEYLSIYKLPNSNSQDPPNDQNRSQVRFHVANFDINAVGPTSW